MFTSLPPSHLRSPLALEVLSVASGLLMACTHAPQPLGPGIPPAGFVTSAVFDSARSITVLPNILALDTSRAVLHGVLEIGGRVSALRQDSLFLEPFWIARRDTRRGAPPASRVTAYRGGSERLPDLAIIELGPDVRLGKQSRGFGSRVMQDLPLIAGAVGGIYATLYFFRK